MYLSPVASVLRALGKDTVDTYRQVFEGTNDEGSRRIAFQWMVVLGREKSGDQWVDDLFARVPEHNELLLPPKQVYNQRIYRGRLEASGMESPPAPTPLAVHLATSKESDGTNAGMSRYWPVATLLLGAFCIAGYVLWRFKRRKGSF